MYVRVHGWVVQAGSYTQAAQVQGDMQVLGEQLAALRGQEAEALAAADELEAQLGPMEEHAALVGGGQEGRGAMREARRGVGQGSDLHAA